MDREGAPALLRGDRDLADVMPAADDLGGCGRWRLCRARVRGGFRGDHYGYGRRRKAAAQQWPRWLIVWQRGLAPRGSPTMGTFRGTSVISCRSIRRDAKRPPLTSRSRCDEVHAIASSWMPSCMPGMNPQQNGDAP